MTSVRPLATCLLLLAVSAFAGDPGQKEKIRRQTLGGIDRGLRNEVPRNVEATGGVRESPVMPAVVPGRVLVRFRHGRDVSVREVKDAGADALQVDAPDYADYNVVHLEPGADPERAAAALAARPEVEFAQADYREYPRFVPNDPLYSKQWNLPLINLERGWDLNRGATLAVVVAVLDTGLAFENAVFHYTASAFSLGGQFFPALGPLDLSFAAAPDIVNASRIVSPHDFIWDDNDPVDLDGHGTHVTGTIGELTDNNVGVAGVAFNVRLMPVKVLSTDWDDIFGSPEKGTDDTVARGIRYAADNGANMINMSLGRTGPAAPAVESAIRYAVGKGVFVAIAGGNGFQQGNPLQAIAEIASRVDGAVSVGAVGPGQQRAAYSTTGAYIELAAPGGDFGVSRPEGGVLQQTIDLDLALTFENGPARYTRPRFDAFAYFYFTGTSMAAPHVTGLAALLYQQGIKSPAAIEAALKRFAKDLGSPGRDDEFGAGLIDARTTLRGLGVAR